MTTIYSYILKGFLVFGHGHYGRTLLSVDQDRMIAISKALNRIIKITI
jgi:hypothetical protein